MIGLMVVTDITSVFS